MVSAQVNRWSGRGGDFPDDGGQNFASSLQEGRTVAFIPIAGQVLEQEELAVEVIEIGGYDRNCVRVVELILFALDRVEAVVTQCGRTVLPSNPGFVQNLAV